MTKGLKKICSKGHIFYKNSDCLTCPICEEQRKPRIGFMSQLSAPARRALERRGLTSLKTLSTFSKREILALHGMGPASLPILEKALQEKGLSFRKEV